MSRPLNNTSALHLRRARALRVEAYGLRIQCLAAQLNSIVTHDALAGLEILIQSRASLRRQVIDEPSLTADERTELLEMIRQIKITREDG